MIPIDKNTTDEGLPPNLDESGVSIDEIWAIEAEKRLDAYKKGEIEAIAFEKVFEQDS